MSTKYPDLNGYSLSFNYFSSKNCVAWKEVARATSSCTLKQVFLLHHCSICIKASLCGLLILSQRILKWHILTGWSLIEMINFKASSRILYSQTGILLLFLSCLFYFPQVHGSKRHNNTCTVCHHCLDSW